MDKYKKLAVNTVVFAIGSFGSKILNVLLIRLYTYFIAPDQFSVKENVELTANFLIPIFTFSIAEAIIRFGIDKEYNKASVFGAAIRVGIGGAIILALLSPLLNLLRYLDGYGFILYVYVFCSGFRQICSSFTRATDRVKLFALDGILTTLSLLLFNILFLAVFKLGVLGYLLSVILSDLCSGLFLWKMASLGKYYKTARVKMSFLKEMLIYALPLIPTAVMWTITSLSDRLFVTEMVSDTANGIYSASYRIPNLISIVSVIFFQAWNMSAISEGRSKQLAEFYTKVYRNYQSLMYLAAIWLVAFVKIFTSILLDEKYAESWQFMPLLVAAVLYMSFAQFLSSVYNTRKRTLNSMLTSIIAAASNILLNFLLIPKYGAQGAAFATFVSYFLCYIVRIIDTRRYIPFRVYTVNALLNALLLAFAIIIVLKQSTIWIPLICIVVFLATFFNIGTIIRLIRKILSKRKRPPQAESEEE